MIRKSFKVGAILVRDGVEFVGAAFHEHQFDVAADLDDASLGSSACAGADASQMARANNAAPNRIPPNTTTYPVSCYTSIICAISRNPAPAWR